MSIKASDRNPERTPIKDVQDQPKRNPATLGPSRFQMLMHHRATNAPQLSRLNSKPLFKKAASQHHTPAKPEFVEKPEPLSIKDTDVSSQSSGIQGAASVVEKIHEHDPNTIAHTAVGSGRADDINLLIKKMTLSFQAKQDEARFSIATGVFEGAHFALSTDQRDVRLRVSNASSTAQRLLNEHRSLLKKTLAAREINLQEIAFLS